MAAPKFSPVVAITGSEEYLRQRDVSATINAQIKSGWHVEYVDGASSGSLESALGTGGFFLENPRILVVVTNPEKVKVEILQEHQASGNTDVVVLLDHEGDPKGNTKIGKFIQGLGKWHRNFPVPDKEYKRKDQAERFCTEEARRRERVLPDNVASQMVDRLGTDLGFLAFEVLKVCVLAEAEGVKEITLEMVKGSMAPLNSTEALVIADALMGKNPSAVTLALRRVRKSSKDDPTIQVSQQVGGVVLGWLETASLRDQGKTPDEIVALLGKNDWYVKNKLLPQLQRWTVPELVGLVQSLAQAGQAQRSGSISPWTFLCSHLLRACRASAR